ncbi:hypothetical protein PIB30_004522 [Stylosanthes scabra]|uniref:Uncharacterized protein n=1 Tax=Stylosanthes scabra TaxID=79078 RepID=A0ABU6X2K6_9FABA|nr:hypothetical protein [Stylosanthes scabra]
MKVITRNVKLSCNIARFCSPLALPKAWRIVGTTTALLLNIEWQILPSTKSWWGSIGASHCYLCTLCVLGKKNALKAGFATAGLRLRSNVEWNCMYFGTLYIYS